MKPYLEANLECLEEMYDNLAKLLESVDDEALNWTPLPTDTNSIFAMVTHTVGALHNWLARAVDESIVRDREAEFRARGCKADVLAALEQSRAVLRKRFEQLESVDLAELRAPRPDGHPTRSAAMCVQHSVMHAGEHWGQIQLTAQLYNETVAKK